MVWSVWKQWVHLYFIGHNFSFLPRVTGGTSLYVSLCQSFSQMMCPIIFPPSQRLYYNGLIVFPRNVFFSVHVSRPCTLPCTLFYDGISFLRFRELIAIPKIVFHLRSSIKGCLPMKVVFHWRSSSTRGHPPPKVVFHRRSSSTEGHLSLRVIFHLS